MQKTTSTVSNCSDARPQATTTTTGSNPLPSNPHTAVLYFHGMGSQRRYEEISRLIDCLDRYSYANKERTGSLHEIRPEIEASQNDPGEEVTCIRTKHVISTAPVEQASDVEGSTPEARKRHPKEAWFYEAYWAPLTAGGVPSLDVLRWLLKQIPYPIQAIFTPWRLRARLRRSYLFGLRSRLQSELQEDAVFRSVLADYDTFENRQSWRKYPRGRFRDFLSYIKSQHEGDKRLPLFIKLAKKWRRSYYFAQAGFLFLLITIALSAILAVLATIWLVVSGFHLVSGLTLGIPSATLQPSWSNVSAIIGGFATVIGVNAFLRDNLGDVQIWSTYSETDRKYKKRHEILSSTTTLLRHILSDERCQRLVIVAHSLGTAIALDSLLEIARRDRLRPQSNLCGLRIDKIDIFITVGSPIDKIHYFFESHAAKYSGYSHLVESLRGDIGTAPFAKNGKPQVHWINVWDSADIISGSLETPANRRRAELVIDNVEVASCGFPLPGKSHSAYFEHRRVVALLFDAIYGDQLSFSKAPLVEGLGYNYDSIRVEPGSGLRRTRIFQGFAVAVPWLILAAVLSHVSVNPLVELRLEQIVGAVCGFLGIGFIVSAPWRHRSPIT
jgi:hypothetical protein